jgi:hypothetical protein
MEKNKLELVKTPEEKEEKDSLTELLRIGSYSQKWCMQRMLGDVSC